jgi:RNA polymerase sigma-70 factor (ECF subfamily)
VPPSGSNLEHLSGFPGASGWVSRNRRVVAPICGKLRQALPVMPTLLAEFELAGPVPQPRAPRIESPLSDEELVRRLVGGDRWAKEALYRRYVRIVWSTALRLCGSRADADDIAQDTFIEALRDVSALRDVEALRPWLLRIAVHQAQRRFRRRSLLRRLGFGSGDDEASLAALADPAASPELRAELSRVDRALADASVAERFTWILRHVEGNTLEEVAALSECSLATAKRRLQRVNAAVLAAFDEGSARAP